ncbi:putative lipase 2 [Parathielavia appendiculata]|uniref:Carboxylic ester hydrolase n=1 Tax=Parathielavia appendiculata TaxID=2587402 RepID=A0AAN6TR32_9PEZI|nr:putative lipase 2 [Parathielavia appendiculata]
MPALWRFLIFFLGILAPFPSVDARSKPAGLVDLGYAKHVPTYVNTTASGRKVSVYKNIRFANSPTGNLRFRLPDTRLPKVPGIQDGNVPDSENHCISSAHPGAPFPPYNGTTWGREDCLFLDVYVPDNVKPGDNVPVLHYFVGSAFAFGSKEMFFSPLGLFDVMDDDRKFIFVANNYRLGLPGWTYMPGEDMTANLGMHDCLAAVGWTSEYIRRFGGDPRRVTVLGQSAGAGIIGLLTVLDGGKGKLPFQQASAWASSPDIPPRRNTVERQRRMFQLILDAADCTSLDCLRSLPEQELLRLNHLFINVLPSESGPGLFGPVPGFGPVPDGSFIPDTPQALFQRGDFHKELKSLVLGNVANEGMGLSFDVGMPENFPFLVRQIFTTASKKTITDMQSMYDFAGNPARLAWDWTTDVIFACNAANIANAYQDRARRYIFSAPPAVHGQDLSYIFYADQETTPAEDVQATVVFRKNLLNFLYGCRIDWPHYGRDKKITNVTATEFDTMPLPADLDARCQKVNKMVLDLANGV